MRVPFDANSANENRFTDTSLGSGFLAYRECPFESMCFQNHTAEILEWDSEHFPQLFALFLENNGFKQGDLLSVRLPAHDIAAIKQAETAGFYFIESTIIPFIHLRNWNRARFERFIKPMEKVTEVTISIVEEIARSSFRDGRFNLDPNIGNNRSDYRYKMWLRNAYDAGEDIQIIKYRDQIAGFSLLRFEDDKASYRMACIHSELKNSGLGMLLFASTMVYCMELGIKYISGGINMANLPVLNTMSNLGFSFREPSIVLHRYID